MSDATRITLQVCVSLIMVAAVVWAMFRMPRKDESFFGWAPPLAFASTWAGLFAVVGSSLLWVLPNPDLWVVSLFLVLDPLALAAGTLVFWIYREYNTDSETVRYQRLQAVIGITLGLIAVTLGYIYVMTHKTIGSPVGL